LSLLLFWALVAGVQAGEPIPIGHRGLPQYAPENTLPAFAACVELGVGFELDLYSSRDDRLVVIHSPNLNSTTDGPNRSVREFTVAELRKFDAGSRFHPSFHGVGIPTFEEILAMVGQRKRGPTMIALNVKQVTAGGERQLVALVAQYGLLDQSFAFDQDDACSRRLKSYNPAFRIGQNVSRQSLAGRLAQNDLDVFLLTAVPTAEEVALLHAKQKTVVFNFSGPGPARRNPETWDRIKQAGVDGLLTDFPLECRLHWRIAAQ
jgi:glycerophosphoryl diester phosphodiesterase